MPVEEPDASERSWLHMLVPAYHVLLALGVLASVARSVQGLAGVAGDSGFAIPLAATAAALGAGLAGLLVYAAYRLWTDGDDAIQVALGAQTAILAISGVVLGQNLELSAGLFAGLQFAVWGCSTATRRRARTTRRGTRSRTRPRTDRRGRPHRQGVRCSPWSPSRLPSGSRMSKTW